MSTGREGPQSAIGRPDPTRPDDALSSPVGIAILLAAQRFAAGLLGVAAVRVARAGLVFLRAHAMTGSSMGAIADCAH